jgi:hypothetical protein
MDGTISLLVAMVQNFTTPDFESGVVFFYCYFDLSRVSINCTSVFCQSISHTCTNVIFRGYD